MQYETPELIDLGIAEEVVLGSRKPFTDEMNGTGLALGSVDEDVN